MNENDHENLILDTHTNNVNFDYTIEENIFNKLSCFLKNHTGINLPYSDKNQTLLSSRVARVLKQYQLKNHKEFYNKLIEGEKKLIDEFILAMTTNMTSFFREANHFDLLPSLIEKLLIRKRSLCQYDLRIWCSASSTGEEPYTIAMVLNENIPKNEGWQLHFLSTDIDKAVLTKASIGIYGEKEMSNVPESYNLRFFEKGKGRHLGYHRVIKDLRDKINFALFNLVEEYYPFQHKFDIIFCRNVLIYFEKEQIEKTIKKFEACLNEDGYLFLGHSESILNGPESLKSIAPSVYKKGKTLEKI
ncbi:CheR family methyltransferase [Fluviispira multicolorata]|uniref:protein-glutamate O-methyltransferase n=1 Tax=Fluviispira multicolorata TaxID=2654512 RepID=A0A833JFG5_9BACT|nr:protein-glutamate O-methyltransferase CheR [Fluviispira multicolorata]KAB8033741.1 protein-glutamate O-methyltransferase CheR [Fluviispira multicolorata]